MSSWQNPYQEREKSRRAQGEARGPCPPGSRNGWWMSECAKHGNTAHMDVIGGRCCVCQQEGLQAAGLLDRRVR